ncbi:MAG: hypothetical protein EB059_06210 [Alphaproteobacteria bacterium]|nr:hypothetical protein [Alphaproteobacteria bacterium]
MDMPPDDQGTISLWAQFREWAHRKKAFKKIALWLTIASVIIGLTTFALITLRVPIMGGDTTIKTLLTMCLICLVALAGLIFYRLIRVIMLTRRQGRGKSALHLRMVSVFSLLAVAPTVVVALFAGLFFYLGVQSWFSDRVQKVVTCLISLLMRNLTHAR